MTDQIVTKIIDFLKQLETALPPSEACHGKYPHTITYKEYPSEAGPIDKLRLYVTTEKGWQIFYFDDSDFHEPIPVLVSKISELMQETMIPWDEPARPNMVGDEAETSLIQPQNTKNAPKPVL